MKKSIKNLSEPKGKAWWEIFDPIKQDALPSH